MYFPLSTQKDCYTDNGGCIKTLGMEVCGICMVKHGVLVAPPTVSYDRKVPQTFKTPFRVQRITYVKIDDSIAYLPYFLTFNYE